MQKEAKARIRINHLLQRSGWRFFDNQGGPANVTLEAHVRLKKRALDELGDDFEKTARGFVDYLLLDDGGFPVAVLEAKAGQCELLVGREQPAGAFRLHLAQRGQRGDREAHRDHRPARP